MSDPDIEPVISSTVFFELPYDIGADLTHAWTYLDEEPWRGWDKDSMAGLIGSRRRSRAAFARSTGSPSAARRAGGRTVQPPWRWRSPSCSWQASPTCAP
jgi:hypothetical protein